MLKRTLMPVALLAALAAHGAAAQEVQIPQMKPDAKDQKTEPRAPQPPPQLANVRLELTITDQRGTAPAVTKTVTLVLSDRGSGRIRTSGDVRTPQGYRSVTLNVDAHPTLLRDGRVQMNVTLEFRPTIGEGTSVEETPTSISELINVILDDGKPLVVSQSADPHTDRRVRVEMRATILK